MKNLYFLFEDNDSMSLTTRDLSVITDIISDDVHGAVEKEEQKQYTITPVWMTEEEFEKLPEAEY